MNLQYIPHARLGLILVSSAGIVANLVFAFLAVLLLRLLSPSPSESTGLFLYYLAQINIMLASFNLIPIPPLDGSKILMGFMPERLQYAFSRLEPFGFFIIIGLLYLGALDPVIHLFSSIILALIALLLS